MRSSESYVRNAIDLEITFHPDATRELREAALFYGSKRIGLRRAFLTEVERSVRAARAAPMQATEATPGIRMWLVRRFPYSIFFRVRDDGIQVLAVAHQKRNPRYWDERA